MSVESQGPKPETSERRDFLGAITLGLGAAALQACGGSDKKDPPAEEDVLDTVAPGDTGPGDTGGGGGTPDTGPGMDAGPDTDTGPGMDTGPHTDVTEWKPEPFPNQDDMEVRWGFLFDLGKCYGCHSCTVACKTEHDVRLRVFRSSVRNLEFGEFPDTKRTYAPWLCNQCANPPCIGRCPVEPIDAALIFPGGDEVTYKRAATYQRPDGLVLIDKDRCVGCGYCVEDCPYGVRYLDPIEEAGGDETAKAADKCDFCLARLEQGIVPACVNTCPAGARVIGNVNDPDSEISKLIAANETYTLLPELETEPRAYYIGADPKDAFGFGDDPKLDAQVAHPEHHTAKA